MFIRKLRFNQREIKNLTNYLDGYAWAAVDIKKGIIAVGDETFSQLRLGLFGQACRLADIYGVGIDLRTGEIYYRSFINKKSLEPGSTKEVPYEKRERIEDLMRYFFSELPIYQTRRPRYTKIPEFRLL